MVTIAFRLAPITVLDAYTLYLLPNPYNSSLK